MGAALTRNTAFSSRLSKIFIFKQLLNFLRLGSSKIAGFGRTCWLVTGILAAVLLLSILILGYAVYAYRREGEQDSYGRPSGRIIFCFFLLLSAPRAPAYTYYL